MYLLFFYFKISNYINYFNEGEENFYDLEIILRGSAASRKKAEELINNLIYKKKPTEVIPEVDEITTEVKELTVDDEEVFPNWAELLERSVGSILIDCK